MEQELDTETCAHGTDDNEPEESTLSLDEARALDFECPRCGAPGGRQCLTMNMRVRKTWKKSHLPRIKRPHRERVIHAKHERETIARIKAELPDNWRDS